MSTSALPDLLHGLANVVSGAAPEPTAGLRDLVERAESMGAVVQRRDHSVVIRFPGDGTVPEVSVIVAMGDVHDDSSRSPGVDLADLAQAHSRAELAAAFATAVNTGEVTDEIDAATGWDPDLAV